ncbi:enoyl-CoA hydratase/isomerase family protein [Janibacter melonis]|uniref:enoyl-CoA hydratase/isomerase family protein n=1 Tax=Janibacter melonis TaxID=262209 RepID=UPI00191B7C51|nr:enoyl-CoA hydratase-related protein [Janibacter melonis]
MSAADAVRVEQHGSVRVLVLNRPERRNALGMQERVALADALAEATAADDVRAVVLTGAGAVFCAGGDVSTMTADLEVARRRMVAMEAVTRAIVECPVPVVAAVEGGAFGAGLAVAAACDVVVAAQDARFCASFAKVGLTADAGATWALTRRVGWSRAKQLLLTASTVPADVAHGWGLVDERVAAGTALEHALGVAERLAGLPPLSLRATKELLATLPPALDDAMTAESTAQLALFGTEDFAEGQSAFAQRRRPVFLGR